MDIKSFDFKPQFIDEEGEAYLDLSEVSFRLSSESGVSGVVISDQEYEGRPDLFALDYFQSTSNIDVFCYINSIYNPFSTKSNEAYYTLTPSTKDWSRPMLTNDSDIQTNNQTEDTERLSRIDPNRLERLKKLAQEENLLINPLPPNINSSGDGKILLNTGGISLGNR